LNETTPENETPPPKKHGNSSEMIFTVVDFLRVGFYAACVLLFINRFVWQNFNIPTESMENTLLIGDHLTVNTFVYQGKTTWERAIFPFRDVRRGDVVVFKYPNNERDRFIKRCIGLPGDTFRIVNDSVIVNGETLDEPYAYYKEPGIPRRDPENRNRPMNYDEQGTGLKHATYRPRADLDLDYMRKKTAWCLSRFQENNKHHYDRLIARLEDGGGGTIPPGYFLVMGDNRNNSSDSRSWGLVPRELMQGKAWFVWWSYGEELNSHQRNAVQRIAGVLQIPYTLWTRTRLEESLSLVR
jgi:signal peptidase I